MRFFIFCFLSYALAVLQSSVILFRVLSFCLFNGFDSFCLCVLSVLAAFELLPPTRRPAHPPTTKGGGDLHCRLADGSMFGSFLTFHCSEAKNKKHPRTAPSLLCPACALGELSLAYMLNLKLYCHGTVRDNNTGTPCTILPITPLNGGKSEGNNKNTNP